MQQYPEYYSGLHISLAHETTSDVCLCCLYSDVGDVINVFSQFGEVVDCNLVRDKDTGKSRGFAFVAYEDQRSTVLAVDNFNGSKVRHHNILPWSLGIDRLRDISRLTKNG